MKKEQSIFREKRNPIPTEKKSFYKSEHVNIKTHDGDIPRARVYSLSSTLHFSEYYGLTIQDLILTDFDYFLWFPRVIEGFNYTNDVLIYAKKVLQNLKAIEQSGEKTMTKLGYQIQQVILMCEYEYILDYEDNPSLLNAYKEMVDENCYKSIPRNLLTLIRQTNDGDKLNLSDDKRLEYFETIKNKTI